MHRRWHAIVIRGCGEPVVITGIESLYQLNFSDLHVFSQTVASSTIVEPMKT